MFRTNIACLKVAREAARFNSYEGRPPFI